MVALTEREFVREKEPQSFAAWVVVFDKKHEKVLLVRERALRKEGMVGLPGGRPIFNSRETLQEAALRELREETGLRTSLDALISYPDNTYIGVNQRGRIEQNYAAKAFIVTDYQGELKRETSTGKTFWATISKLDKRGNRLAPSVKTVVSEALNFLNNQSQ